jgi:DNA recombination protein RmuC
MEIILIIITLVAGIAIGILLANRKNKQNVELLSAAETQKKISESEVDSLKIQINEIKNLQTEAQNKILELTAKNSSLESENKNLLTKVSEAQKEFEKNKEQLKQEFENLANIILEKKSEKFTQINKEKLEGILNPFKDKIEKFEKKVEESYQKESNERFSLKNEVKNLVELNQGLREEAKRLTNALTGNVKKQGNWGEFILAKVLERSGLVEGREYETQYNTQGEDNNRLFPDVVIKLPQDKHLIIDSKVSLIAYERFVNAETEAEKEAAIKQHIISVKNHIKELADKNYAQAKGIKSPDFVLLFMPIESSFGAAIESDSDLFGFAWERKIVIVSPSTLLATLKTVESLWRQENQNRNAEKIAQEAGSLIDKLEGLVSDLIKLGNQMNTAQNTYNDAFGKLKSGRGNLVSKAEKLRLMGAKATKNINKNILDEAMENDGFDPNESNYEEEN